MIDRIVVAFDGSEMSRHAFACGLMIAGAARVEMLALHVVEPSLPVVIPPDPVVGFDPNPMLLQSVAADAEDRRREDAAFERSLADLAAQAERAGVRCKTLVDEGILLERLIDEAGASDLIAVGMKGRFARAGVGSTTKELVADGPCPVLIVNSEPRGLRKIVGVYDGAGAAKRAVEWARSAAVQTGWGFGVLAVGGSRLSTEAALEKARALSKGGEVIHYEPGGQDLSKQIQAAAAHSEIGLLAIGAYSESWLHQLLFGSTAMQALGAVKGPVVLVR